MIFPILILHLICSVLSSSAPISSDSPTNFKAVANFEGPIQGSILFQSANNASVQVDLNLSGFGVKDGPFSYHINEFSVPTKGGCSKTGGVLDPYNGDNIGNLSNYQIGDLSGKWGNLTTYSLSQSYVDNYLSLSESDKESIIDKSLVVYFNNGSTLACSNITLVNEANSGNNYTVISSNDKNSTKTIKSKNDGYSIGYNGQLSVFMFVVYMFI